MAAEIILTKVNTTTCDSVNETFRDDTFIIDESIDNDKEKDISQDIIIDLVDTVVASSKEDDDTMPPVDHDEESKESKNTEMNTSCARNCKESLPIPTTSCIEEVPLTSSTPPPLPTEPITAAAVVVSDDEPSPIQQNETNETIDIGDIMSPLDCIKDDEKGLASDKQTDEENANYTANEESAASTNDNDVALQSKEQDNSSPQNQATIQPLSKLNLEPTKTATESSTASSVILSDSGESKCTLTSTLPVINLTMSGKEDRDEKLVALGVFVKPANGDGDEGSNAKVDEDVGKESSMTQSTADDGDAPVDETIDNKDTGRSESRLNTNEQVETTSATIPSALSPTSLTSTSSNSILLDKKRLSERLKQRLAKRNSDSTTGDGPLIPTTKPPPKRDTARDREQWETRLRAASRHKRASKTRTKSIDDTNSDILSRYSGSDEIDVGGSHKIYPDTVTFSDGEDDINDVNDVSSKTVVNRRTAYRKCVSEVGGSSLRPTQSPTKLSKHHHSHHHGIGILQSDGIVYDDALLLRLARQARFGQGRGEASTNASSAASSEAKGGVDSRANEVKIHVYDLLAKDSLVEVPYLGCNFPIGQCFKTLNDGCHVLGTGAYHVGVEINGVEYAFGANNIIGMSGIFTCVPKESPGYEFRETLDFGKLHTTKRTWIRIPKSGKGATFQNISKAFSSSIDTQDEKKSPESPANSAPSKDMNHLYSFREIESFADGHSIVHSLAREYMGTDYDLLRKNCCTFARDLCIRLGVKEKDIPSWFHNAAQAGANAEDAITTAENNMRRLVECNQQGGDPLDGENKDHGFEVLIDGEMLKVVESPTMRTPGMRRPLSDTCESIYETSSWY